MAPIASYVAITRIKSREGLLILWGYASAADLFCVGVLDVERRRSLDVTMLLEGRLYTPRLESWRLGRLG